MIDVNFLKPVDVVEIDLVVNNNVDEAFCDPNELNNEFKNQSKELYNVEISNNIKDFLNKYEQLSHFVFDERNYLNVLIDMRVILGSINNIFKQLNKNMHTTIQSLKEYHNIKEPIQESLFKLED